MRLTSHVSETSQPSALSNAWRFYPPRLSSLKRFVSDERTCCSQVGVISDVRRSTRNNASYRARRCCLHGQLDLSDRRCPCPYYLLAFLVSLKLLQSGHNVYIRMRSLDALMNFPTATSPLVKSLARLFCSDFPQLNQDEEYLFSGDCAIYPSNRSRNVYFSCKENYHFMRKLSSILLMPWYGYDMV
jgi:hypothetical protein